MPADGSNEAEQHPDRRRLARAVGAEEAVDRSRVGHGEVEAVDGGPAAEDAWSVPGSSRSARCPGDVRRSGSGRVTSPPARRTAASGPTAPTATRPSSVITAEKGCPRAGARGPTSGDRWAGAEHGRAGRAGPLRRTRPGHSARAGQGVRRQRGDDDRAPSGADDLRRAWQVSPRSRAAWSRRLRGPRVRRGARLGDRRAGRRGERELARVGLGEVDRGEADLEGRVGVRLVE